MRRTIEYARTLANFASRYERPTTVRVAPSLRPLVSATRLSLEDCVMDVLEPVKCTDTAGLSAVLLGALAIAVEEPTSATGAARLIGFSVVLMGL
jgi:hypothetical protein